MATNRKPDVGLFVGIFSGIAGLFFFVLQANGVEVNWLWSLLIYLLCTGGAVWTALAHALPSKGRWIKWTIGTLLALLCLTLGSIGTFKQYKKEHLPKSAEASAGLPAPTSSNQTQRQQQAGIPYSEAKHVTLKPQIKIDLVLGADKGIGKDAIANCENPLYTCLDEAAAERQILPLDLGSKGWARIIFRIINIGNARLEKPSVHVESPNGVSMDRPNFPDPNRLPRNIIDALDQEQAIQPFSIVKGAYAFPVDIIVPEDTAELRLSIKVFGDNMSAHQVNLKFKVQRSPMQP